MGEVVKNWCYQFDQGTAKLTLSREGTDAIECFFSCWYKFRKSETCFIDFWVDVVKNGHGLLDLETLKSAAT